MAGRKLGIRITFRAGNSRTIAVFLIVSVWLTLGMLTSICSHAQVAGAIISGVVTDVSGAAIPNVTVSVKNSATDATRIAITDSAGFYSMPNILPGNYSVAASATGFSTRIETSITLEVGASRVLDLSLKVGKVSETIQVAGSSPTVDLETSAINAVVSSTTVRELPLNGRSWTDLATLQPGVVSVQTHAFQDVNRGYGSQVAISGARLKSDEEYLASDRDIRELMGARKLYIADVFDVDSRSLTRKPFGRVFYTEGKSLIVYAFDLDHQQDLKNADTFQAWGQREDRGRPLNLGIFYMDSESNRRWVLRVDDSTQLAGIDTMFVTVEPHGGSRRPTGKPFLYASLRKEANHP
jgi:hypothetical protein